MKAKVHVDAGVCGFQTAVEASTEDGQNVSFAIVSDCEKIRAMAQTLSAHGPVDAYAEVGPAGSSVVLTAGSKAAKGCCASCVVPAAIFKSAQVAAGLALPKDIAITIATE